MNEVSVRVADVERRVSLIFDKAPTELDSRGQKFQPESMKVVLTLTAGTWRLARVDVSGRKFKKDGALGNAPARHTWFGFEDVPEWVAELVRQYEED